MKAKATITLSLLLLAILGTVIFLHTYDSKNTPPTSEAAVSCNMDADKLLGYINAERAKLGAPELHTDTTLAQASTLRSDDMISQGYFSHQTPNGQWYDVVRSLGVKAKVSEDLGSNDDTPEEAWAEFKSSAAHYESLTNPQYTRVGISTKCTTYKLTKSIEPGDDQYLGTTTTDLTVVTLAANEPQR
jgi:uncharacterized protein YkwD